MILGNHGFIVPLRNPFQELVVRSSHSLEKMSALVTHSHSTAVKKWTLAPGLARLNTSYYLWFSVHRKKVTNENRECLLNMN